MNEITVARPVFFCDCEGIIRVIPRREEDKEMKCRICGKPMYVGHSIG